MLNNNLPSWFNSKEYSEFLAESSILFEIKQSTRTPIKAEKHRMRPQVDPSKNERDRKRESRRQDGQVSIMKQIIIVKNNNSNKVEIILKTDFDKSLHTILKGRLGNIDKGDISRTDLSHYSNMKEFVNTKTSIKLLGRIDNNENSSKAKNKSSGKSDNSDNEIPVPPNIRVPKNGKEITDEFSTYPDWDHTPNQINSVLPDALNYLSGKQPPIEYQQAIDSSRTLSSCIERIVKEIAKTFPEAAQMEFSLPEESYPTGKLWNNMNVPEAAGNINLIGVSETSSLGVSVKIGEQIRPGIKGEAGLVLNTALSLIDPRTIFESFSLMIKDFVENLRSDFSKNFIESGQSTMDQQGSLLLNRQRLKNDFVTNRQERLINTSANLFESYLNENLDIKSAFLNELLTGNGKFEGNPGSAQVMLTANKDGTDATIIPLNSDFITKFAKSQDTNLRLKFSKKENSSNGFLPSLFQKIAQINESSLDVVYAIEKIKDQISMPETFLQAFELELVDAVFETPVSYSSFYSGNSDTDNTVIFDFGASTEQTINIPVKIIFDPEGDAEDLIQRGADSLMESYLFSNDYLVEQINNGQITKDEAIKILNNQFNLFEDSKAGIAKPKQRNYRREYDNYQGKAKQRKNRSKRVLARRKMAKLGKVSKGDGKDVNHKDGNPQNNSIKNLEAISAHKNRSIHEDHGAGFEGTPELVNKLSNNTPFSNHAAKNCTGCKTYSEIRKKKKKKKK